MLMHNFLTKYDTYGKRITSGLHVLADFKTKVHNDDENTL